MQRTHDLKSRMRQSRTSGSVGAPGGRLPGATRPLYAEGIDLFRPRMRVLPEAAAGLKAIVRCQSSSGPQRDPPNVQPSRW